MRYWIRPDGIDYTLSYDDMGRYGYVEVTKRPDEYPLIWLWNFDTSTWYPDAVKLGSLIRSTRAAKEELGVTIDGNKYDTFIASRLRLLEQLSYLTNDTDKALIRLADNTYIELAKPQLTEVFNKVTHYINQCVLREQAIFAAIAAGTFEVISGVEEGWPSNDLDTPVVTEPEPETPEEPKAEPAEGE